MPVRYEMIIAKISKKLYLLNILYTAYLRIEVFDGVTKQLMKNVMSARTWALTTSQGVSRFKNLKRTKSNRVTIINVSIYLTSE